ncbi:hypothetical protein K6L44_08735 [Gluconacetobacter entanii]|uniref:Uncharacterized protein n=1 Tax=Gluconacetobacter entanii TaxID=108528 RepID=A0ABT3K9V1_9PROT|nr:hypothetical protein [Gluconacetobacter entanii]MBE7619492.1 hypothetical protein [Komagataeibacter sp. FXV2]MCE2577805.1 hypothetical protein [Komagataeibacter sp. FNDCR1]MBY4640071.1 hypothetical protein [Gluconacetobacter entanii]MCW4581428.1 hypothetical protein [Gluconacetobacter entanii]MCW4584732.1 hypothetical protein [Gluconacetobacter entanii]
MILKSFSQVREVSMSMYLHRTVRGTVPRTRGLGRWDILGPALLATAFALSTALIFFE